MFDGLRSILTGQRDPHRAIQRAEPASCLESSDCRCERCARGLIVSRRWFLGATGVIGAGLVLPKLELAAPLAPLPPGWTASRDGVGLYTISHPMSAAEFRKVLQGTLNEVFATAYERYVPPFSNGALEQLEIDIRRA